MATESLGSSYAPTGDLSAGELSVERSAVKPPVPEVATKVFTTSLEAHASMEFGKITVIVGGSTAGKSSMISKLIESEPHLAETGGDIVFTQILVQEAERLLATLPAQEAQIFRASLRQVPTNNQFLDAILGETFNFNEGASSEDQEITKRVAKSLRESLRKFEDAKRPEIELNLFNNVVAISRLGVDVIFDVLEIDSIFKHAIQHAPKLKIALVYCPFSELTSRLEIRNEEAMKTGNVGSVRAGAYPLFQFARLFGPKQNEGDLVVETVTRKQVEEAFDINFTREITFRTRNLDADDKAKLTAEIEAFRAQDKEELLQLLGFTDSSIERVDLTPRSKRYDVLIDTKSTKPPESAEILKKLQS